MICSQNPPQQCLYNGISLQNKQIFQASTKQAKLVGAPNKTCHVDNKSIYLFSLKVIQPSNSGIICGENEYAIINSTGNVQSCLSCDTCHKGFGLHPKCGSALQHPPMTACHACKTGTFSSAYDSSPCKACHQCAEHEIKIAECTNKNDTVCSRKCEKGYFKSETLHNCQECSACCSDGKDEKIKECVSQGITNKECSPRLDKTCAGQLAGTATTTSTTTITTITDATKVSGGLAMEHWIIIIVVIVVATVAIFMIVMIYMYFRLKRRSSANTGKLALYL